MRLFERGQTVDNTTHELGAFEALQVEGAAQQLAKNPPSQADWFSALKQRLDPATAASLERGNVTITAEVAVPLGDEVTTIEKGAGSLLSRQQVTYQLNDQGELIGLTRETETHQPHSRTESRTPKVAITKVVISHRPPTDDWEPNDFVTYDTAAPSFEPRKKQLLYHKPVTFQLGGRTFRVPFLGDRFYQDADFRDWYAKRGYVVIGD